MWRRVLATQRPLYAATRTGPQTGAGLCWRKAGVWVPRLTRQDTPKPSKAQTPSLLPNESSGAAIRIRSQPVLRTTNRPKTASRRAPNSGGCPPAHLLIAWPLRRLHLRTSRDSLSELRVDEGILTRRTAYPPRAALKTKCLTYRGRAHDACFAALIPLLPTACFFRLVLTMAGDLASCADLLAHEQALSTPVKNACRPGVPSKRCPCTGEPQLRGIARDYGGRTWVQSADLSIHSDMNICLS